MKSNPKKTGSKLALCSAVVGLVAAVAIVPAQAQKLGVPGGWKWYQTASDNFNDGALGWQWKTINRFENSQYKNGGSTVTRFRSQNVQMTGSIAKIVNWYHTTPVNEGGRSFNYSGGWMESNATWLTEGQFQARLKVDWRFADIWPTFWTYKSGGDELDIMEYQSAQLNQTHHGHFRSDKPKTARIWATWNTAGWEYNWAMDRVTNWTNWAARGTRNSMPTFYINGKKENTSKVRPVVSSMKMLFTSSPHQKHLPAKGNYPNLNVDWVETHIP